jgi:hypothetical protein
MHPQRGIAADYEVTMKTHISLQHTTEDIPDNRFADGERVELHQLDWRRIKPLIWW